MKLRDVFFLPNPDTIDLSPSLWTMDFQIRSILNLLIISSLLISLAQAETRGSVFFIDSHTRQYLLTPSQKDVVQSATMSLPEVGAAVSVLLGFAPSNMLSAAGSSKLNEVLSPNPFNRPRAVLMLEVNGELPSVTDKTNAIFSTAFKSQIIPSTDKADIQLPGEDVSVVSLDENFADLTDREIGDFASWLGGSYVLDPMESLNGELAIPLASGATMNLHMSKKVDREFVATLLTMLHNSRRAVDMHEDLSQSTQKPSELLNGCFNGMKALQKHYGSEGTVEQGLELLLTVLSKMLDSLQAAYKGQIVGVILFNATPATESEPMLNVKLTFQPSARWLEETKVPSNATITEVVLVRKTLAWITGIILIIATLLGIYFLLNMPRTKDTLLYSNVKLD